FSKNLWRLLLNCIKAFGFSTSHKNSQHASRLERGFKLGCPLPPVGWHRRRYSGQWSGLLAEAATRQPSRFPRRGRRNHSQANEEGRMKNAESRRNNICPD